MSVPPPPIYRNHGTPLLKAYLYRFCLVSSMAGIPERHGFLSGSTVCAWNPGRSVLLRNGFRGAGAWLRHRSASSLSPTFRSPVQHGSYKRVRGTVKSPIVLYIGLEKHSIGLRVNGALGLICEMTASDKSWETLFYSSKSRKFFPFKIAETFLNNRVGKRFSACSAGLKLNEALNYTKSRGPYRSNF